MEEFYIGQWHTVRALESGTVIMEVKDGPYEPTGEEDNSQGSVARSDTVPEAGMMLNDTCL